MHHLIKHIYKKKSGIRHDLSLEYYNTAPSVGHTHPSPICGEHGEGWLIWPYHFYPHPSRLAKVVFIFIMGGQEGYAPWAHHNVPPCVIVDAVWLHPASSPEEEELFYWQMWVVTHTLRPSVLMSFPHADVTLAPLPFKQQPAEHLGNICAPEIKSHLFLWAWWTGPVQRLYVSLLGVNCLVAPLRPRGVCIHSGFSCNLPPACVWETTWRCKMGKTKTCLQQLLTVFSVIVLSLKVSPERHHCHEHVLYCQERHLIPGSDNKPCTCFSSRNPSASS